MKLVKFSYSPILGWSFSRYGMFSSCKRQYWYNYYAKYDREFPLNVIDLQKKLTSRHLEVGSISHYIIAEALKWSARNKSIPSYEKMLLKLEKEEKELFAKDFYEVYYREMDGIPKEEILEKVKLALKNVVESGKLNWVFENSIKNSDGWLVEPDGYGETKIGGLKAYCKVDFLFSIGDKVHIIDWKSGKKKESHIEQLLGYATFASYHFRKPIDKIETTVSYILPEYEEKTVIFNQTDLDEFPNRVKRETEEMYSYLVDIEQNKPKTKDNFPMTENIRTCKFCNYKELCKRDEIVKVSNDDEF